MRWLRGCAQFAVCLWLRHADGVRIELLRACQLTSPARGRGAMSNARSSPVAARPQRAPRRQRILALWRFEQTTQHAVVGTTNSSHSYEALVASCIAASYVRSDSVDSKLQKFNVN